jgi:hypothetical protein
MAYTEDELMNAGRQLAGAIKGLSGRLEALESGPVRRQMETDWRAGQQYARSKGYSANDLNRLEENVMIPRGLASHYDAIKLDPTPPSGKGWFLNGLPADELQLAMEGKIDAFERLATSRALRGE